MWREIAYLASSWLRPSWSCKRCGALRSSTSASTSC